MTRYARVIVEVEPAHLDRLFDYRIPADADAGVGSRVEVVFNGRRLLGLVAATSDETAVPTGRIRELRRVLGDHRWATPDEIELFRWAGNRFAAPVADVVRHALPRRVVDVERRAAEAGWYPGPVRSRNRAGRPRVDGVSGADPSSGGTGSGTGDAWEVYASKTDNLLERVRAGRAGSVYWRPLPGEDLGARLIELVTATLDGDRDVLLVVPEPVSAAVDAVCAAVGDLVVDVRGETSPRDTYRAWLAARTGRARLVVGERGAVFWPLERLGLAIVLDESSPALKERRSPRHHAREVVLERARRARAVGVLVGTVPSAQGWRLLATRRLTAVTPVRDAEREAAPVVTVDDRSDPRSVGRLGSPAIEALGTAVGAGRLGVVVAARRGEGRALVCSRCGLRYACPVCGSSLAVETTADGSADEAEGRGGPAETGGRGFVLCEGCGWRPDPAENAGRLTCDECDSNRFAPLAAGAERIGAELSRTFADTRVAVLEGYARTPPEAPAIIVATRGSVLTDPPGPVGAVVLPDFEGQLRRPTLDAAEDALRVAMRAAGWLSLPRRIGDTRDSDRGTGRRGQATGGRAVVQAQDPGHHAVQALVGWDPGGFWRSEVDRRAELSFPPVAHAVRIEVVGGSGRDTEDADGGDGGGDGGGDDGHGRRIGDDLRQRLPTDDVVLGPRPVNGRLGFLVKAVERTDTVAVLKQLQSEWSQAGVDVRVDVDPVDVL